MTPPLPPLWMDEDVMDGWMNVPADGCPSVHPPLKSAVTGGSGWRMLGRGMFRVDGDDVDDDDDEDDVLKHTQ